MTMARTWIAALMLICLGVSAGFAASFNFSASEQYLIKGDAVVFTFTCDLAPDERPQTLTIELDYDGDRETDHTLSVNNPEGRVRREQSVTYGNPGYFDAEAEFTLTFDGGGTTREHLGPLRINVANWKFAASGCIASTPAVSPDGATVYFGSANHCLYAVSTQDGTQKWRRCMGGEVDSSPAIDSAGYIYVGSEDGHVYCLTQQGAIEWQFPAGAQGRGDFFSSPALDEEQNRLYIGSTDSYLYALDMSDGSLAWRFKTGGKIVSSPAVGFDHTVYIGSLDASLYALNPDGTLQWRFDADTEVRGSPALDRDGTIYFGTSLFRGEANADNGLYALSTAGQKKWFAQNWGGITAAPVIDDDSGTVVVSSWQNRIYGIGRSGGGLGMYKTFDDDVLSGPALGSKNYLFAGAKDGKFYAMDIGRGNNRTGREEFWDYRLPQPVAGSSPVIDNEYVYVGTCENDGEDGSGALYSFFADLDQDDSRTIEPEEDSPWPQFRNDSRNTGMTALRPDTIAPEVSIADPAPGVTEFDTNRRRISATFSMPMEPDSIYQAPDPAIDFEGFFGFTVEPFEAEPEEFTIDWNAAHTVFTLTLPQGVSFEPETTYTAAINAGAHAEGEPDRKILYDYEWTFRHDPEEHTDNSHDNQFSCFISVIGK